MMHHHIPSLGLPELDNEHRHIFDLIAEMRMALSKEDLLVAYAQARALVEAAGLHLRHEEHLLVAWEGRDNHLACHKRFETSLQLFFTRYPHLDSLNDDWASGDLKSLVDYAEGWLAYHIKFEDMNFVTYVQELESGPSSRR